MKLIIHEYLSLLKESNELDALLPDLLLAMGIEPFSKPQVGVRQYGVDVAAVGQDEDGIKKLFLYTIKQGNIGRSDWDTNEQSVRQSFNEIEDVYLVNYVKPEHKDLPKKIILCTGGDLKQEMEQTWNAYVSKHNKNGEIEYCFWGGYKLTLLIEKYIFNEQLFPEELRDYARKTLALLSDPDYNLEHYNLLINKVLFGSRYKKSSPNKEIIKTLRLINLFLNVVLSWAKSEGNLKPALYAAERTVLLVWDFIRKNSFFKRKSLITEYVKCYATLRRIYIAYFNKIQPHCFVKDGLSGYGNDFIQESIIIFEQVGIISFLGLMCSADIQANQDENLNVIIKRIIDTLKSLINNHHTSYSPCYDGHIIEISLAIYFLVINNEIKFIENWIRRIIDHVFFAYSKLGKYFPIQSDSFDDLVMLNISNRINKEKMMELSTLIPILAQWCVVLNLTDLYNEIRKGVSKFFPDCIMQIWYPDEDSEQYIYMSNASLESGIVEAPIELPQNMGELITRIKKVQERTIKLEQISSIREGILLVAILSSRHYRTPPLPFLWQGIVLHETPNGS